MWSQLHEPARLAEHGLLFDPLVVISLPLLLYVISRHTSSRQQDKFTMAVGSVLGAFAYLGSVAMALYSLLAMNWATMSMSNVDVAGLGPTSATFRMGLFSMKARISHQEAVSYKSDCYAWCGGESGPLFSDHESAYCQLLTSAQVTGVLSAALGLCAFLVCLGLSTNLIRFRSRRCVSGFATSLVFFQMLCAFVVLALMLCIRKLINSDLEQTLGPAFKTELSTSWFVMLASALIGVLCFSALARTTPEEGLSISLSATDVDEEAGRVKGNIHEVKTDKADTDGGAPAAHTYE